MNSEFGTQPCQYAVGNSWYDFSTNSSEQYSASPRESSVTAQWAFCEYLDSTTPTGSCNGPYRAQILDASGLCALNANTMTMTTSSSANSIDVAYTNTDPATNGGISSLTVTYSCGDTATGPSNLQGNSISGYTTTQTSPEACPIFTLNTLFVMIGKFRWIFGLLFIGIGGFLSVLGRKYFP